MGKNSESGLEKQIREIVENVVDTKNFEQLNKNISDTVNSALNEVKGMLKGSGIENKKEETQEKQGNSSNEKYNKKIYQYQPNSYNKKIYQYQGNTYKKNSMPKHMNTPSNVRKSAVPVIKRNPKGSVAGILYTVFGYIGIGSSSFLIISYLIVAFFLGIGNIASQILLCILIPLLLLGIIMAYRGSVLRKRIKRYQGYLGQMNGKEYGLIKQLASNVGASEKYVIKDLKKMIQLGLFPQGHIDDQKTCFMLTAEMYEQYLQSQDELKRRQIEEEKEELEDEATKELKKVIGEGEGYIREIKEANESISELELSNKLYRLEIITSKIFDHVAKHPYQLPEIRKFMNYYLPTTLKLMKAYQEFDMQPIQGENILKAKSEIRKTLDTINQAFENLLDSLFEDAAMDVSTDISVLETMLAQEGLTEKDFDIK